MSSYHSVHYDTTNLDLTRGWFTGLRIKVKIPHAITREAYMMADCWVHPPVIGPRILLKNLGSILNVKLETTWHLRRRPNPWNKDNHPRNYEQELKIKFMI